jgi:hypothetical protein
MCLDPQFGFTAFEVMPSADYFTRGALIFTITLRARREKIGETTRKRKEPAAETAAD